MEQRLREQPNNDCPKLLTVDVDGQPLRIFSNHMCDLSRYVDFDPEKECGIKERVRFTVLQELLEQYEGDELKQAIRSHVDDLVPKHVIVDDIFASINYMNALAKGLAAKDDIDHLGNRRLRCVKLTSPASWLPDCLLPCRSEERRVGKECAA